MQINHDSGYHDLIEDEMEIDKRATAPTLNIPEPSGQTVPPLFHVPKTRPSREQSAFDVSFHSAKEELSREPSKEAPNALDRSQISPQATEVQKVARSEDTASPQLQETEPSHDAIIGTELGDKGSVLDEDVGNESLRSASAGSTPALKGLVRKSSLTFATLPAREPLTTKKSIGARISRTSHVDPAKGVMGRRSFLGRITGGKSSGGSRQPEVESETYDNDHMDLDESGRPSTRHEVSDSEAKVTESHNKSSTQRLHERINMLGKSQPARPTKSIPAAATLPQPSYPDLSIDPAPRKNTEQSSRMDEEDDDWIKPPTVGAHDSSRPVLSKSVSADVMENLRGKVNISDQEFGRNHPEKGASLRRHSLPRDSECGSPKVAKPSTAAEEYPTQSTTPAETPALNRYADGPLSASKSKLQSIMKTARGLFTSSAGASAQAKMELRNQPQVGSPHVSSPSKPAGKKIDTGLYPVLRTDPKTTTPLTGFPVNPAKPIAEGRKTRASIEKENKEKECQRANIELERIANESSPKVGISKQETGQNVEISAPDRLDGASITDLDQPPKTQQQVIRKSPRQIQNPQDANSTPEATEENDLDSVTAKSSQPPPSSNQSQLHRPNTKRPIKPAKEAAPKPEPQRVAIRVGTLSQRIPLTNAALSSSLQDSLPPPPSKRPGLAKKTSGASVQTAASNNGLRSAVNSKPKALIVAERKKEQVSALLIQLQYSHVAWPSAYF